MVEERGELGDSKPDVWRRKSTRPVGGFTGERAVFFPDFFHKKMEKFAIFGFSPPQSFPPRFHGGSSPGRTSPRNQPGPESGSGHGLAWQSK